MRRPWSTSQLGQVGLGVLFAIGFWASLGCQRVSEEASPKTQDASGSVPNTTVENEVSQETLAHNEGDLDGTLSPLDVPLDNEPVADLVVVETRDAAESPRDVADRIFRALLGTESRSETADVPTRDRPRPSLRALMVEEIAPRFGVPEKRAELLELLDTLPTYVDEPQRERWRAWLQEPELRGSLAILCKRCHSEHASSIAGRER